MLIEMGSYKIRDWEKEDAPAVAKYANNRKIWQNLRDGFPFPYSYADAENFLSLALSMKPRSYFAIASDDEAIGSIGLGIGVDVHRFTAELGFWLAEPFWSKGIMSETVSRFTDFAFEDFGLHRIFAEPYATNPASARVLEKAGFHFEGTLKANVYKDGKVLDQLLYSKVRVDNTI